MNLPKLTEPVRSNAIFDRYEDGTLWYKIDWTYVDSSGDMDWRVFSFPIQVVGSGDTNGTFNHCEKGVTLMRWIRKHLEFLQTAVTGADQD